MSTAASVSPRSDPGVHPWWQALPFAAVFLAFFVIPLGLVLMVSFWDFNEYELLPAFTWRNYVSMWEGCGRLNEYGDFCVTLSTYLSTLKFALLSWALTLVLGFALAYFLAFHVHSVGMQTLLFVLCTVPFWTSNVIRMIAWVPLLAGWKWENLLTPVHIIFLELVMGPTCSIAFENEPAEAGQMQQPPRPLSSTFLAGAELGRSLVQGLGITLAVLGVYYGASQQGQSEAAVRTLVFTTLVVSNMLLTLVNRSFTQSVFQTLRVPNRVLWLMLGLTLLLLLATLLVPAAQRLFGFVPVSTGALGWCGLTALVGVGWVEIYKAVLRSKA